MGRPFLVLFATSTLLATAAIAAAKAILAGGALPAALLFVVLAVPAGLGLVALIRGAYLDGRAGRERVAAARVLRRRL